MDHEGDVEAGLNGADVALGRGAIQPSLGTIYPFSSGHQRAQIVVALFVGAILLFLAMFACSFQEFRMMGDLGDEFPAANEQTRHIEANLQLQNLLRYANIPCYILTVIAFLTWEHRAHRNLPSLGATALDFSPRGAVGWYFFPFLNLFRPYQVMREIANASNPAYYSTNGLAWRGRNAPAAVRLWWAFFLIANVVGRAVTRAESHADTPRAFQIVAGASMVDSTLTIIAAVAAVRVVWLIDRRQSALATTLGLG